MITDSLSKLTQSLRETSFKIGQQSPMSAEITLAV